MGPVSKVLSMERDIPCRDTQGTFLSFWRGGIVFSFFFHVRSSPGLFNDRGLSLITRFWNLHRFDSWDLKKDLATSPGQCPWVCVWCHRRKASRQLAMALHFENCFCNSENCPFLWQIYERTTHFVFPRGAHILFSFAVEMNTWQRFLSRYPRFGMFIRTTAGILHQSWRSRGLLQCLDLLRILFYERIDLEHTHQLRKAHLFSRAKKSIYY